MQVHPAVQRLVDCHQTIIELKEAYREARYNAGAEAYAGAQILNDDDEAYLSFIEAPFWNERKTRPHENRTKNKKSLIFFAFDFIVRTKDVNKIYKAVRGLEYLKALRTSPKDVKAKIKEVGGYDQLYSLAVEKEPRRQTDNRVARKSSTRSIKQSAQVSLPSEQLKEIYGEGGRGSIDEHDAIFTALDVDWPKYERDRILAEYRCSSPQGRKAILEMLRARKLAGLGDEHLWGEETDADELGVDDDDEDDEDDETSNGDVAPPPDCILVEADLAHICLAQRVSYGHDLHLVATRVRGGRGLRFVLKEASLRADRKDDCGG